MKKFIIHTVLMVSGHSWTVHNSFCHMLNVVHAARLRLSLAHNSCAMLPWLVIN